MSVRKSVLFLICIALVLVVIAGSTLAASKVTIIYGQFSAGSQNAQTLDQMKALFEKKNPGIEVKIEATGYGEYFTQLQTRLVGGTAPDCYELNYENFVTFAAKNVLLDLGPMFPSARISKTAFDKSALKAFSYKGKQYGVPESYSCVLLIYNKDVFDKAGVGYPTEKWTWQDIIAAGKKIRALGQDYYGLLQPIHFWEFYKVIVQNNGSLFNADATKFAINSQANVEALQYMVDNHNKYNITPTKTQQSGQGDYDMFYTGKIGMIITGNWAFTDFIQKCKFKWDIAVEPGNKRKGCHFFSNGIVVNKNSKYPKEALKWAGFMSSDKECAMLRIKAAWEVPAVSNKEAINLYVSQKPPENRKAVFDSLKYLVTPPVIEQFNEMATIVTEQLEKARDGEKTPQQALDDAQKALETKIKL